MENNKKITISYSFPIATIIFLAFFFAKIFDKIDWSWWWVFSPLWLPFAIILGLLAIGGVIYVIGTLIVTILEWKTWK